jgi:hypothetical protein
VVKSETGQAMDSILGLYENRQLKVVFEYGSYGSQPSFQSAQQTRNATVDFADEELRPSARRIVDSILFQSEVPKPTSPQRR